MKNHEHYTHDENVERISDEGLFDAYRHGDGYALAELHSRYRRELLSYLFGYIGNMELAEDAMQMAFLNISRNANSFDAAKKFRPWLYGIATNAAIDMQRREKRHRHMASLDRDYSSNEDADSLGDVIISPTTPADVNLERQEDAQSVRNYVSALREDLRNAIQLIYFKHLKYREAAEVLHIPVGTVKSRLHKALMELLEMMNGSTFVTEASGGGHNRR